MKKIIVAAMIVLFLCPAVFARQVEGVQVPEAITVDGQKLVLNGAGLRIKKIVFVKIDVYAAGLYLPTKTPDAAAIINADEPMAIRMYMITNLASKEKLHHGWAEGFKIATRGNTAPIQNQIAKFNSLFNKDPKEGDMYEISYVPGKGIRVAMNGKIQGEAIPGMAFKKAVFGIWLSDAIANSRLKILKSELLGK